MKSSPSGGRAAWLLFGHLVPNDARDLVVGNRVQKQDITEHQGLAADCPGGVLARS
jgi:hypothetical protein